MFRDSELPENEEEYMESLRKASATRMTESDRERMMETVAVPSFLPKPVPPPISGSSNSARRDTTNAFSSAAASGSSWHPISVLTSCV